MQDQVCCSFCGKSSREVSALVAGNGGVHICDECVEASAMAMANKDAPQRNLDPTTWPTERLLVALGPLNAMTESHRRHLGDVVDALRRRNVSWAKIAQPLGVSRQTAHERFG